MNTDQEEEPTNSNVTKCHVIKSSCDPNATNSLSFQMSPWEKVVQLSRQTPKTFVGNSATPSRPRGLRESHDDHMIVRLTSFIVSSSMSCNSSML